MWLVMNAPRKQDVEHRLVAYYNTPGIRADVEARMIAELAMDAHKAGYEFVRWPVITETRDRNTETIVLKASVWSIPR